MYKQRSWWIKGQILAKKAIFGHFHPSEQAWLQPEQAFLILLSLFGTLQRRTVAATPPRSCSRGLKNVPYGTSQALFGHFGRSFFISINSAGSRAAVVPQNTFLGQVEQRGPTEQVPGGSRGLPGAAKVGAPWQPPIWSTSQSSCSKTTNFWGQQFFFGRRWGKSTQKCL